MNVTRNVIADLWALANAGEASEDSRRLIGEFLATDPDFASTLRDEGSTLAGGAAVALPPNHEAETLDRTRKQLRRHSPFRILAVVLTGLAVARLIEDTSFTASPRRFVATAVVALISWILYAWHTRRLREGALTGRSGQTV